MPAAKRLGRCFQERDIISRSVWQPRDYAYLALCLLLTLFAVAPLAYPGYLQVHTGFVPFYQLADLTGHPLTLSWTPNQITPFDPLRGDGLLPYYIAGGLIALGSQPLAALRLVLGLGVVLGAIGMFVWLRRWWGGEAGLVGALVYTYLPFHLAAYLVRGSLGETLLLGLLPLAIYLVVSPKRPGPGAVLLTAVVWLLLGFSQLGLALLALPLAVLWLLLSRRLAARSRSIPWTLLAAVVGLALSAAATLSLTGWQTLTSYVNFSDHFLFVSQLLSPYWGFGASRAGWNDGLSLGFGLAAAGLALLALTLALSQATRTGEDKSQDPDRPITTLAIALGLAGLLSLFLFQPSQSVWHLLQLDQLLTYPWQLLGLIGLCLSITAAGSLRLQKRLASPPLLASLVIFVLLASYPYLEPRTTQLAPPERLPTTWDSGHLMLMDLQVKAAIPQSSAGLTQATPGRLPLAEYGPPGPGDTLWFNLTWQAARPFDGDLKLFVHLLDVSGAMVAQVDPPAGITINAAGELVDYPASQWQPGELVVAQVELPIPPSAPAGPYQLALGLYDPLSLERLSLPDVPENQLLLDLSILGRDMDSMGRDNE